MNWGVLVLAFVCACVSFSAPWFFPHVYNALCLFQQDKPLIKVKRNSVAGKRRFRPYVRRWLAYCITEICFCLMEAIIIFETRAQKTMDAICMFGAAYNSTYEYANNDDPQQPCTFFRQTLTNKHVLQTAYMLTFCPINFLFGARAHSPADIQNEWSPTKFTLMRDN